MITLNGERGFEKVESWDEILSLPGFTEKIDPKLHELKEIIGRYIFKDYISCGLSGCRQPHGKGYLVTTKTGEVTNIGNGCGKTHFGVEFKQLSNRFDRAITEHNNREAIASFLFQIETNLERVGDIRSQDTGADWDYKLSQCLVQKGRGCPESIVSELGKMIRSRNGTIMKYRLASEEEVNDLEVIKGEKIERPHYVEENEGMLRGIESLFPENDLRKLLVLDIESHIKQLIEFDIDNFQYKDLQFWAKWCGSFEEKLERSEQILSQGRKLLRKDNLLQLVKLLDSPIDIKEYKRWISSNLKN